MLVFQIRTRKADSVPIVLSGFTWQKSLELTDLLFQGLEKGYSEPHYYSFNNPSNHIIKIQSPN